MHNRTTAVFVSQLRAIRFKINASTYAHQKQCWGKDSPDVMLHSYQLQNPGFAPLAGQALQKNVGWMKRGQMDRGESAGNWVFKYMLRTF